MKTVRYSSLIMNFYAIGKQNTGIDNLHPQTAPNLTALSEFREVISRYRQQTMGASSQNEFNVNLS